MTELRLEPFDPAAAGTVSGWATTVDEVMMWCSRSEAPVPPDVIAGWSHAVDVHAYGLLETGRLIGYGEVWVDDDEAEAELARLIVAPDRRGLGLGRRLVALLVEVAQATYPTVVLRVAPENAAAQRCYRGAGFVRASAEDEAEWNQGQPTDYVWMTWQKDPSALES